jgi:hypothetical protein
VESSVVVERPDDEEEEEDLRPRERVTRGGEEITVAFFKQKGLLFLLFLALPLPSRSLVMLEGKIGWDRPESEESVASVLSSPTLKVSEGLTTAEARGKSGGEGEEEVVADEAVVFTIGGSFVTMDTR